MSQENVEIVRKAAEAFNLHDADALTALSHRDMEFVSVLTAVEAGGATYRGPDAWEEYFAVMEETWDEWSLEVFDIFDATDDRAVAVIRLVGTGRHSGARAGITAGLAYWFREGKIWRLHTYPDPAEALEAVGLRE
jgi:ketosteroid isomerase-like protein